MKRSVSASLAKEVLMMSEGLAEYEWVGGVFLSWWFIKTKNARYRTAICRSIRPHCVCHRRQKFLRSSGRRVDWRSL